MRSPPGVCASKGHGAEILSTEPDLTWLLAGGRTCLALLVAAGIHWSSPLAAIFRWDRSHPNKTAFGLDQLGSVPSEQTTAFIIQK